MHFYLPTKIYNEHNCIQNHKTELASLGTKALIVTGSHSSKKNGSLDHVMTALHDMDKPYCLFDEIEENPSVELMVRAAEFGKKECADFIIGIGGGSPLDASKAIAILMKNPEYDGSVFYQKIELDAYPVAAIPTTAGTGSEITPYAILTRHDKQTKQSIYQKVFPKLALIDSQYLLTASIQVRANTAIDALAHLLESYVNCKATDYSRMFCEYALKLFSRIKDRLKEEATTKIPSKDLDFYDTLMTISTIAGMTISHTGTSLPHGMSYFLTYHHNIPHGKAVGTFLGSYLEHCKEESTKTLLLSLMGFESIKDFKQFLHNVLSTVSLTTDEINTYSDNMMENTTKLTNCPYPITKGLMQKMFLESVILAVEIAD